ncbi:TPA: hypothetical protein ACQJXC_006325, partial [Raoultella ornithinolytica]
QPMTSKFTREQRINEVKELIANAEEWAGFYEHPIHDKPQREMFEGMAKVMSEHLAALAEMDSEPVAESEQLAIENFRSAMEGIGHIRRTLEETFGGLHGTHVEPDVLAECKAICDTIYAAYRHAQPAPVVQCPFPCGWDNLNKLAIQDAELVACGLVEGELTTEAHRQAAISNNDRLLKVISSCRA